MRLVFATVLLMSVLPATAQIYQYTDAKGNRVYTDRPPVDAKASTIDLPPINSVTDSQRDTTARDDSAPQTVVQLAPYSTLQLVGLPEEQALRANNGSFIAQIEIAPSLAPEHRLQLLLNEQPYGPVTSSVRMVVNNLERGEHRLAVQVLAGEQVIQTSSEQTLFLQRVHNASPAFSAKPKPLFAP